jgi:AraC-like DNA-binding protein
LKILFEKLNFPHSTSIRALEVSGFNSPYSYHPEYEIVYILSGNGTRLIGQKPEPFEAGEVVLLGPNVYHWWKPNDNPRLVDQEIAIVIQWSAQLFETFSALPELKVLKTIEDLANQGVFYGSDTQHPIREKIKKMINIEECYRIPLLIEILLDMNNISSQKTLHGQIRKANEDLPPIIERSVVYILEHLHSNLTLAGVAEKFNLSIAHFSRLFKKSTDLSFPRFINKHRVSAICQAMEQSDLNIAELAFSYGYENLSTFNRVFKENMGITPLKYRKRQYN